MVLVYLYSGFSKPWLLYIAGMLGFIALFTPILAALLVKAWMKLGELMGAVMNRVVLGAVFYLVLTPVALLARLSKKKDTLSLHKHNRASYFVVRNHTYAASDLTNSW